MAQKLRIDQILPLKALWSELRSRRRRYRKPLHNSWCREQDLFLNSSSREKLRRRCVKLKSRGSRTKNMEKNNDSLAQELAKF